MSRKRNFRSYEAYHKWLAYDKMHISKGPSRHPLEIKIRGRHHKVCHNCGKPATGHHKYPCCHMGTCCVHNSEGEIMTGYDALGQLSGGEPLHDPFGLLA